MGPECLEIVVLIEDIEGFRALGAFWAFGALEAVGSLRYSMSSAEESEPS